jgi:hypothetical protein
LLLQTPEPQMPPTTAIDATEMTVVATSHIQRGTTFSLLLFRSLVLLFLCWSMIATVALVPNIGRGTPTAHAGSSC